jgi:hypothetical protein
MHPVPVCEAAFVGRSAPRRRLELPGNSLSGAMGEEGVVLQCPACGSGWVVVGLPYRGTLSCVSCHNQWARQSAPLHTAEGEWYDRHLSPPRQRENPSKQGTAPR